MCDATMIRFVWSKRKLMAAVAVCVILAVASVALWHESQNAQAAVLNPHPGLVGWWRFDEGSGTVASDSSGYGNVGTIYGATWVTGEYGTALSFDGASNYVSIPHNSVLNFGTGSFTVEAWIKTTDTFSGEHIILRKDLESQSPRRLYSMLYLGTGYVKFQVYDSSVTPSEASIVSSIQVNDGNWHHVVGVKDGSNYYIYVDGIQRGSYTETTPHNGNNTGTIKLGRYTEVQGAYFNGAIDEAQIYNRALSAAEAQESFQKGSAFSSKLLAIAPKGTTQFITTVSWQGIGSINVTIISPSQNYTEDIVPVYQKTVYSTSSGTSSMLNIKRLSVSVNALSSDQNWYIMLTFDHVDDYQAAVEVQK
jgi:hypothetical protein